MPKRIPVLVTDDQHRRYHLAAQVLGVTVSETARAALEALCQRAMAEHPEMAAMLADKENDNGAQV